MKIALLSRWMWEENRRAGGPDGPGGTAQQLAEALQDRGHEVVVLTQSDPARSNAQLLHRSRLGRLEVWETPRWRRSLMASPVDKALKFLWGHRKALTDATDLFEFLKQRGPFDVLWAQCEEPDGVVAGLADLISIVPPILCHTYALRYGFQGMRPSFTDVWALRFAYSRSRLAVANSPLVARHMEKDYGTPSTKIRVLPHNLTRTFLAATAATADGGANSLTAISSEPGRILFLGALNRKKGALLFANAARLLGYRHESSAEQKMTFVIIGGVTDADTKFDAEWRATIAACKEIAILELPGKLRAEDVAKEIRRASVVVVPSLFDEWNRALVEALALGRPVVTTTGVGAHYLATRDGSGLVVDLIAAESDSDTDNDGPSGRGGGPAAALADAIARIASDPGFSEAAEAKAAAIRQEFSPEAIAAQLEALLQETMRTTKR
ncbi:MAG: glycosyltransferase family 4 protein [Candidatus Methylacidiphilales bacterium]